MSGRVIVTKWPKKPLVIDTGSEKIISVVFTWQVEKALSIGKELGITKIGGPGAKLMGLECGDYPDAIKFHNPLATFTTRGCIKKCPFCAVSKLEGEFRELSYWRPSPIICDNNLLAGSESHFKKVIDSVLPFGWVDFNQGLDCTLVTDDHFRELSRIKRTIIRFAFDNIKIENVIVDKINKAKDFGFQDIRVYVLIGYKDSPEDALYRLNLLKGLGVWTNPMRYQPINAKNKNEYVEEGWTDYELKRMMKYWANLRITKKIPYAEFDPKLCGKKNYELR